MGKRFDEELKTEVVTWFGGKEASDEWWFDGRGRLGGRMVTGQAQAPREFNPITQGTTASGDITNQALFQGLIDYNYDDDCYYPSGTIRGWEHTPDGKVYTFYMRRGALWSDGQPLTLDDVEFTFKVIFDPKVTNAYGEFFLQSDGSLAQFERVRDEAFRLRLKEPSAQITLSLGAMRVVPKHILGAAYARGEFESAYGVASDPKQLVSNGPFRLKQYVPDQRVVLERNPHFGRMGHDLDGRPVRLPYLDEFVFLILPTMDAQFLSFMANDLDMLYPLQATNYPATKAREESKHDVEVVNLGPAIGSQFLILNQNPRKADSGKPYVDPVKLAWFTTKAFRQAISYAIDRDAIAKTAFQSLAVPQIADKTSESRLWNTSTVRRYPHNPDRAKQILLGIGFSDRNGDGVIEDASGNPVSFVLNTNADNPARVMMMSMIQKDLELVGIKVVAQTVDIGALTKKLRESFEWEAIVVGLSSGVPNDPILSHNVYLSNGVSHLWNRAPQRDAAEQPQPCTPWEKRLDELCLKNAHQITYEERKASWDEIQMLLAEELPMIWLVKPHELVAAKVGIGNYRPKILRPCNFWNLEELYWEKR